MNYLVCGPPGSGKTTYVRDHATPGDLIVDLDALMSAVSGLPWYEKPEGLLPAVYAMRDALYAQVETGGEWPNAWVIAGLPDAGERLELAEQLGAEVLMMDVNYFECLRRISTDKRRRAKTELWEPLIKRWWHNYQPADSETIIR